ncbi:MAG: M24 family metallopeptidase [Bacteroidota bacterium]|nr:M24 family metallopeptidase [Bacteroidota bacterium]
MFNYEARAGHLRAALRKTRADAFITSFLPHVRYLTGYSGSNGLCIVTDSSLTLLTDFRYQEQIEAEVPLASKHIVKGDLFAAAVKEKLLSYFGSVAFEEGYLPVGSFQLLKEKLPQVRLVPSSGIVESLTAVKEGSEIALIKKAAEITERVFEKVLGIVKPGISENDIAAEIGYLHRKFGAEKDSFDTIVASGTRGSLPHGAASSKKIQKGEMVTLDFGCVYQGYCSDLTRTVAVGTPSSEVKKIYQIVLDAQRSAIHAAHSGLPAKKLDAVARSLIEKKGFGKFFGHGLGHGIGLQVHESPRLFAKSKHLLCAGNVVTIEPGIYLPGKFGVRIEDDVVIHNGACEVITSSPKELIVV